MLDVKEVTTETTVTPVAHSPGEVLGLVNIRSHIYLVLDLRQLLGMPTAELTSNCRLVLFKPNVGNAFGIVVDEISEIHTLLPNQIEAFSADDQDFVTARLDRVDLIAAIGKLQDELLVILNPRRFLTIVDQNFARSA